MQFRNPFERTYARWQIRRAARLLEDPDTAKRNRAYAHLHASSPQCWSALRRIAFRQRNALAISAAELLYDMGDSQGLYALLEQFADGAMHGSYGQRLRHALRMVGPTKITAVLEFALNRIESQPLNRYCWSLSLAVYALHALKWLQTDLTPALWRRILCLYVPEFEDLRDCRAILPVIATEDTFSTPRTTWGVGRTVAAVRAIGIDALLTVARPRAFELLKEAIQSPQPQIQLTAIYGLRRLRDERAAVLLQPIAADRRHPLMRDAYRAIEAFGTRKPDSITLVRASQSTYETPEELLRPASYTSSPEEAKTLLRSHDEA